MSTQPRNWKLLRSTTAFTSSHLTVRRDVFRRPGGRTHDHMVVVGGRVVAILALTDRNEVVLVRQYRPAVKQYTFDLPGGGIERNESPIAAARRELREETGYHAGRMSLLAKYFSDSGRSDQVRYLFLARGLDHGKKSDDPAEKIKVTLVSLNRLMRSTSLNENTLLTAILLYRTKYNMNGSPDNRGS